MSKYTKVIAALGVAAGLGVASLPFGAFATETTHTGTVDIEATVPETLVVKIDNTEIAAGDTEEGNAVIFDDGTVTNAGDPKVVNAGKSAVAKDATTLFISTNQPNGFKLSIQNTSKQADGTNISTDGALLRDGGKDANNDDKIKPFAAETTVEDDSNTEGWGFYIAKEVKDMTVASPSFNPADISNTDYKTDTATFTSGHGYFGVPVASTVLDDVYKATGMTEAEYQYKVSYGINIAKGKAAGTYKGQVTYVVTANPARS